MKGLATLDTGHESGVGEGLSRASSSTPIVAPPGWHITEGFTQPGIKATVPRHVRWWLSKLQANDRDARAEAVVEEMEEDDTNDEILKMLDDVSPQRSSGLPSAPTVMHIYWNLTFPAGFTNKIQVNDNGSEAL